MQERKNTQTYPDSATCASDRGFCGELYTVPFSVGHKLLNPTVDHMAASCPCLQWVGTYLQTDGTWHQLEWENMHSPWTHIVYFYTAKTSRANATGLLLSLGFSIWVWQMLEVRNNLCKVNPVLCAPKCTTRAPPVSTHLQRLVVILLISNKLYPSQ